MKRLSFGWIPLAFGLGFLGCGPPAGPATGEVSGKVAFEGKPVNEGMIAFMNSEAGTGGEAKLTPEGTYSLPSPLPVGDYKVTIIPLIVRQQDGGKGPVVGVEKAAPNIPPKYQVIGSTDLKATVEAGKNDLNFEMKRP